MLRFGLVFLVIQSIFIQNAYSQQCPIRAAQSQLQAQNLNLLSSINYGNVGNTGLNLGLNSAPCNNANYLNDANNAALIGLLNNNGVQNNGLINAAQNFGGVGTGEFSCYGDLPVGGQAAVNGNVPVVGVVQFDGTIPATGVVSLYAGLPCECQSYSY